VSSVDSGISSPNFIFFNFISPKENYAIILWLCFFVATVYNIIIIIIIIIIINLLAQKHDKVTRTTKQIELDSKDTDATNSCPYAQAVNVPSIYIIVPVHLVAQQ